MDRSRSRSSHRLTNSYTLFFVSFYFSRTFDISRRGRRDVETQRSGIDSHFAYNRNASVYKRARRLSLSTCVNNVVKKKARDTGTYVSKVSFVLFFCSNYCRAERFSFPFLFFLLNPPPPAPRLWIKMRGRSSGTVHVKRRSISSRELNCSFIKCERTRVEKVYLSFKINPRYSSGQYYHEQE